MEVFHYVANQTKKKSLFECGLNEITVHGKGAIFNDYDYNTEDLLTSTRYDDIFPSCSASVPSTSRPVVDQETVEFAILEADRTHGVLYKETCFDTDLFDCTAESCNDDYMDKVKTLLVSNEGMF